MTPTQVFDTYWRFAAERQRVFFRRLAALASPWTRDPILQTWRFTNAYRVADRVSQYLIGEVQYRDDRSQEPREIFFRTLLFKLFNRIETWEELERRGGPLSWSGAGLDTLGGTLDDMLARGQRIYSAAYIIPSPPFGYARKHANHLALVKAMMDDGLPDTIRRARSLRAVYEMLLRYPGLGRFLAFQFAVDLNYSRLLDFSEADCVVAGPGALDGIAKCFADCGGLPPEDVIFWATERQGVEFKRLGLSFQDLFGRPLQPIDCQNLFCEISKYARVAHPEVKSPSGRFRIKQGYHPNRAPLRSPVFPPRWGLNVPPAQQHTLAAKARQFELL